MTLHFTNCCTWIATLALFAACAPGKTETDGADGTGTGAGTGTTDDLSGTATGQPTSGSGSASMSATEIDDTGIAEETGQTSDTNGGCVETPMPLGLEDASPLGFSAAEALAGQIGNRTGTLTWSPDGFVSPDLKGAMWPLTFAVDYLDGAINYIESSPGVNGLQEFPEPIFCESRLEITVRLTLTSEAGELAEVREVVTQTVQLGTLEVRNHDLFPPAFMGTLTPEQVIAPPMTLDALDVFAVLLPTDGSGGLNGEVSDPMLGSVGYGTLASFTVGAPM